MRLCAFLVIFLGKSTASTPLRMRLYVFMGSVPAKGGLHNNNNNIENVVNNTESRTKMTLLTSVYVYIYSIGF